VLLQRVSEAAVQVAGSEVARIGPGLLALIGIARDDDVAMAGKLARKTVGLRIFPDADKPMNRSVFDLGGQILVVSQFTLAADTRKGMRPGFSTAAPPELAEPLVEAYAADLEDLLGRPVVRGVFGADMQVSLVNDGPVTFVLDSMP
jgi:D-tyrosyl-tRNA(Tyr) deacylase